MALCIYVGSKINEYESNVSIHTFLLLRSPLVIAP